VTSSRKNWFVTFVELVIVTFTYWSGGTPLGEDSETIAPDMFVTQPLAAVKVIRLLHVVNLLEVCRK
jgi:hypothetical protein